jgi:hypothetical protein
MLLECSFFPEPINGSIRRRLTYDFDRPTLQDPQPLVLSHLQSGTVSIPISSTMAIGLLTMHSFMDTLYTNVNYSGHNACWNYIFAGMKSTPESDSG